MSGSTRQESPKNPVSGGQLLSARVRPYFSAAKDDSGIKIAMTTTIHTCAASTQTGERSMEAFLSILTVTTLVFGLSFAWIWLLRRKDPTDSTWSATLPVLGGPVPPTHAWTQYHIRYYSMALLFIAFEMEMMFMYPWAVVYVQEGVKALMEMGMFLIILSLGILYAWREGALRWQ